MHPALRLRKLSHQEKSVFGTLLAQGPMKSSELMQRSRFADNRTAFSRLTSQLEQFGLIERLGRQSPWEITPEAKRFAVAPQQRVPVPFDDARVIGHGRDFLTHEQAEKLEQELAPSKIDAATFIRSLSERFIIDLSWASSNLEGNTYDYLDTEKLIRFGDEAEDKDIIETTMILNHKRAVEWMLEIAQDGREIGPNDVCLLHAHLMRGLLPASELGVIRAHDVKIGGSSYRPSGDPLMLRVGMVNALKREQESSNPHEASLGILAGMSYLQAFSDGNKRTARLLASIPLLRAGFAPLSFVGWDKQEYTVGLVVYYETGDPSILADGFVKNQIENSPAYHDLIRAHRVPHRIEVTRRKEIAAAVAHILSTNSSLDDAVDEHFKEEERQAARTVVAEIYEGLNEINAVVWGVDPDLLRNRDGLSM